MSYLELAIFLAGYICTMGIYYYIYENRCLYPDNYTEGVIVISTWIALVLFYICSVMAALEYLVPIK